MKMFGRKRISATKIWQRLPTLLFLLLCTCHIQTTNSLIVPQELPSLLSVIYSNIPPIKKGTDSRVGFGFRLGDHADFQILLEIGPQKNTQPIGDQDQDNQSFNKRQTSAADQRAVLRQQATELTSTERSAATWLESWSSGHKKQVNKPKPRQPSKSHKSTLDPNMSMLPPSPIIRVDAMNQLQKLYKMAISSSTTTSTTLPPPFKALPPLNLGGPKQFTLPPPALSQDTNQLTFIQSKSKTEITKELMDVSLE